MPSPFGISLYSRRYGNPFAMSWLQNGASKRVNWDAEAAAATPFFGIGVCCTEDATYCPRECTGHSGALLLFAYVPLPLGYRELLPIYG